MNTDLLYMPMKRLHPAILAAVLLLPATGMAQKPETAAAPAAAQVSQAMTASHTAAVRKLLELMLLNVQIRWIWEAYYPLDSPLREVMQYMSTHVSDDEIFTKFTPVYGKYLSEDDAKQLIEFYATPLGQRYIRYTLRVEKGVPMDFQPDVTANELGEMLPKSRSSAGLKLNAAQKQIWADSGLLWEAWANEYGKRFLAVFRDNLRELMSVATAFQPDDPVRLFTAKPTGSAYLDKLLAILSDLLLSTKDVTRAYLTDMQGYGLDLALSPERLVSADGIAISKASIAKANERVESYLLEVDKVLQEKRQPLLAMARNKDELKMLERNVATRYDFMLRLGENQRNLLDLFTRILRLAESRVGSIHLEGESLVFQSEADLTLYQTLMAQLKKAVDEEDALDVEAKETAQRALKKLDN
ncbi:DUF2059 domain-containing protein [Janthinobacterium sp. Mn2066]|uniref:DUF2059 domain-containing protein n=1 Tax=Janthinobacterium sp. Mn2066 TaxID=3395264 RepID=UPI003BE00415